MNSTQIAKNGSHAAKTMAQRVMTLRIISLKYLNCCPFGLQLTDRTRRFTEERMGRRAFLGYLEWREEIKVQIAIRVIVLLLVPAVVTVGGAAQVWTVLAVDPKGDGRDASLPDAAQLSYRYDKQQDFLWFRLSLSGRPNEDVFGVNIVLDTEAPEASKMNWWGANKDFRFDKVLTAWVTRGAGGYHGTLGIADAAGARAKDFTNLRRNSLQLRVEDHSILVGVNRTELTDRMKMTLIASIGSNTEWNDDIPNMRSMSLDLTAPGARAGLKARAAGSGPRRTRNCVAASLVAVRQLQWTLLPKAGDQSVIVWVIDTAR